MSIKERFLVFAIISWGFLSAMASFVMATVHINEILPNPEGDDNKEGAGREWVELYNDGGEAVSLVGWKLADAVSNEKSLDGLGEIAAGGFGVYEVEGTQGWMNNSSGDIIVLKNADGEQVGESFAYGSDPGEGVTLGKYPDGSSGWLTMQSPTKGQANSGPLPTATPTPEPTDTPTPTPVPTATLTPAPTLTPQPSVEIPTKKTIPGENVQEKTSPTLSSLRAQILGEQAGDEGKKEAEKKTREEQGGAGVDWLALGLIGGGGAMLGGAGLTIWKARNLKSKAQSELK